MLRLQHGDAAGQEVLDGATVRGGMMEAAAVALPSVPIKQFWFSWPVLRC